MKFAVIVFPGSNCDQDLYYAIRDQLGAEVAYVPHTATSLAGYDAVLIPGGFSYGDYLRCGAIARFAPIMTAVKQADEQNLPIVGICNGLQILTEAGLLPGSLQTNQQAKFICETTPLTIANKQTQFTSQYQATTTIQLPIAHGEGNYYCDAETLAELRAKQQIVFEYGDNPNGSVANIAGIVNEQGNVLGMMPHPERAVENLLGSADGLPLFQSILQHFEEASHA